MAFVWNAFRRARVSRAVASYNRAITMREKELLANGMGEYVRFLPERVTVDSVRERIGSVNDFRRIVGYANDAKRGRTSELTRILRTVRPDALEFQDGTNITNYSAREHAFNQRALNRIRRKSLEYQASELHDGDTAFDFDAMTAAEYSTMVSDTPMAGAGEPDEPYTDVGEDTLERWRLEDERASRHDLDIEVEYDLYVSLWMNPVNMHSEMAGYDDMLDALAWLKENREDVLRKMFNSGAPEMDPYYIVDSDRANNLYVNIDYQVRHNRAVRYVTERARAAGWRR